MAKVTMAQIEEKIRSETYTLLPNGRTTICQLTLTNGFAVEGKSACVDVMEFDENTGTRFAREDAVKKIWELEGYLLAEKLYQAKDFRNES